MKLQITDLDHDVQKVALNGSLDVAGSATADPRFEVIAADTKRLVIDMTQVDFLASLGIRVLVKTAKTIANNGGRMAVFGANETGAAVLKSVGVDRLINLVDSEAAAVAEVTR